MSAGGRRRACAERVGCGASPSLESALEHPDVEAALVLTPNDMHLDVVDPLASWLGPPVAATGRLARLETEADLHDVGVVTLEMASGTLAAVTGSCVSSKTFAIRLAGTRAVLDYRADFSVWPAAEVRAALDASDRDREWQPASP